MYLDRANTIETVYFSINLSGDESTPVSSFIESPTLCFNRAQFLELNQYTTEHGISCLSYPGPHTSVGFLKLFEQQKGVLVEANVSSLDIKKDKTGFVDNFRLNFNDTLKLYWHPNHLTAEIADHLAYDPVKQLHYSLNIQTVIPIVQVADFLSHEADCAAVRVLNNPLISYEQATTGLHFFHVMPTELSMNIAAQAADSRVVPAEIAHKITEQRFYEKATSPYHLFSQQVQKENAESKKWSSLQLAKQHKRLMPSGCG